MKKDEGDNFKCKAWLVLHGHRDRDRFFVRRDSASDKLSTVGLVLSLARVLDLQTLEVDVNGAYIQSGPILKKTVCETAKIFRPESGFCMDTAKNA